jgi:hypothetical protein
VAADVSVLQIFEGCVSEALLDSRTDETRGFNRVGKRLRVCDDMGKKEERNKSRKREEDA